MEQLIALMTQQMAMTTELIASIKGFTEANVALAVAVHNLADAIAAPVDGDGQEVAQDDAGDDGAYMSGRPIGD